jgi:type IV pilus assembly protein PilW
MTCFATPLRSARIPALVQRQRGMTLVELMVAMAIGLLVVLVTVAALLMSRQGAATVDASSQLRDDSRFASQLIQQLVVQAGFEDVDFASATYSASSALYKLKNNLEIGALQPSVYGFDNALVSPSDPLNVSLTRTDSYNGDILILQYQTVKSKVDDDSSSETDGSMITCDGTSPSIAATNRGDRAVSVLHLAVSAGEPTLMCTTRNDTTGVFYTVPLVRGVESFQVLYGVDNVTPGAVLPATPPATGVPNAYLRADQLTVAGNTVATYANWRRVRSLRIGMVLRGPPGSALQATSTTYYPLGVKDHYDSTNDPGSKLTATDNRLRQTVTFTVQLRNCQNQGYQPATSTLPCDVVTPS